MIGLVAGKPAAADEQMGSDLKSLATQFAQVSGATPGSGNVSSLMSVNPHGSGCRDLLLLDGCPPASSKHIYAASTVGSRAAVSIDVPAYGFAVAATGKKPRKQGSLLSRLFSPPKKIADGTTLSNQFMEVAISPSMGGIQGVYSGATRGNRFSLRVVHVCSQVDDEKSTDEASTMAADDVRIVTNGDSVGEIEASGRVLDSDSATIATFTLRYRLERGSRHIHVSGSLETGT